MKKEGMKKVTNEDLEPVEKEDAVNGKEVLSESEDGGIESPVVSDDDYDGSWSAGDDSPINSDSESESGSEQSDFSEDEDGVDDINQGDQSASEDSREVVDESDSSEDEVGPRNTIGDVPL